jgi:MFS family permease
VKGIALLYALFNATCVIAAPWVGRLGDRIGRSRIVVLGYALYGGLNLAAVFADSRPQIGALFALYGLFYAIEESQSKAFIADLEPQRRATAMGLYSVVTGVLYLPASLLAGALWTVAPSLAFALASALSLTAIVAFAALRPGLVPTTGSR